MNAWKHDIAISVFFRILAFSAAEYPSKLGVVLFAECDFVEVIFLPGLHFIWSLSCDHG